MFKLVVLSALLAVAAAGYVADPLAYSLPYTGISSYGVRAGIVPAVGARTIAYGAVKPVLPYSAGIVPVPSYYRAGVLPYSHGYGYSTYGAYPYGYSKFY